MKFTFAHSNINVFNLEKSIEFYDKALGLKESRRKEAGDGSFTLVYLTDGDSKFLLELTWLRDWDRPYNLGDNEIHLAFVASDFDESYRLHKEMGVICYENTNMGVYFIADPDGYWMEVTRDKSKER